MSLHTRKRAVYGPAFPRGPFRMNRDSPQARGLIGWWPMLGSRGSNKLRNYVFNDHGTFSGNAFWNSNPDVGPCVDFDGVADHIGMSNRAEYSADFTGELSVLCWGLARQTNSRDQLAGKGAGSNYEWDLYFNSDGNVRAVFYTSSGGTYLITSTSAQSTYSANTFYQVGFTSIVASELRVFKNGLEVGSDTTTAGAYTAGTAPLRMGERADGGNDLNGLLGELRIYNRSLSAAQVLETYTPQTRWDLYLPIQRVWAVKAPVAAGDPEGPLVGGKLIRGGILSGRLLGA